MKIRLQHLRPTRPLISLDTESTGLDPGASRVVEVAAIRFDSMSKPTSFHRLINPGIPIPYSAALAHGTVDADVRGQHARPVRWDGGSRTQSAFPTQLRGILSIV